MIKTKEKRKVMYAMIVGYSLGLIAQLLDLKEKISGMDRIVQNNKNLFSIGNFGVCIAIGYFLFLAFCEKTILLRIIFLLATIPFIFSFSFLGYLHKPYFNLIEIVGTIVLIVLMIVYLMRNRENMVLPD